MKLYERRNECGKTVEWWTQRNRLGFYFSIFPHEFGNGFSVVINNDDANRKVFAKAKTFQEAETILRNAEQLYSHNRR